MPVLQHPLPPNHPHVPAARHSLPLQPGALRPGSVLQNRRQREAGRSRAAAVPGSPALRCLASLAPRPSDNVLGMDTPGWGAAVTCGPAALWHLEGSRAETRTEVMDVGQGHWTPSFRDQQWRLQALTWLARAQGSSGQGNKLCSQLEMGEKAVSLGCHCPQSAAFLAQRPLCLPSSWHALGHPLIPPGTGPMGAPGTKVVPVPCTSPLHRAHPSAQILHALSCACQSTAWKGLSLPPAPFPVPTGDKGTATAPALGSRSDLQLTAGSSQGDQAAAPALALAPAWA